jgi:hypothetical protein
VRRTDSDGGWGQNLIMSCVRPEARTLGCGKMVGELTEASTAFACCLSPGQYDVFSLSASGKGVGTVEVVSGQDAIYPLAEVTGTGKWDGVTFFVGPTPGPTLRDLTTAPSQTPSLSPTVPTADAGLCLRAVHASELQGGEVDCWTKITDVSTYGGYCECEEEEDGDVMRHVQFPPLSNYTYVHHGGCRGEQGMMTLTLEQCQQASGTASPSVGFGAEWPTGCFVNDGVVYWGGDYGVEYDALEAHGGWAGTRRPLPSSSLTPPA